MEEVRGREESVTPVKLQSWFSTEAAEAYGVRGQSRREMRGCVSI